VGQPPCPSSAEGKADVFSLVSRRLFHSPSPGLSASGMACLPLAWLVCLWHGLSASGTACLPLARLARPPLAGKPQAEYSVPLRGTAGRFILNGKKTVHDRY